MSREHLVVYHPGGDASPVCRDCEPRFVKAKGDNTLVEKDNVRIATLLWDVGRKVVSVRMSEGPIFHKTSRYGSINGLVQDDPCKGQWVHRISEEGWLLARPNFHGEAGAVSGPVIEPGVENEKIWTKAFYVLQGGYAVVSSPEGVRFDFHGYFMTS